MGSIEIPDIASPDALHETTQIACVLRFHQEVNMVGHEHIRIQPRPAFLFGFAQTLEKDLIILRRQKDGLPIVPALDDVIGIRRQAESRRTSHDSQTSHTTEAGTLLHGGMPVNEIVL
jgi:hypothetical protein